jgi:ADP-ribose pyrophosphatase YjhB (NUDIX family)
MALKPDISDFIKYGHKQFIPHLSIDCTIFGYHENELKVLLIKWKDVDGWCLPGGKIGHSESIDDAADRILYEITGLSNVFLHQYYTFGESDRMKENESLLKTSWLYNEAKGSWLDARTVSIGYYALIEFSKVVPKGDEFSIDCSWWDIQKLPLLLFDHEHMINIALQTIRAQLSYQPVGLNLLPEKFTLPELQKLYETILDRKIDRRNFQKKILSLGIIKSLEQRRKIGPHRSPGLYKFDRIKYKRALTESRVHGF